MKRQKGVNSRKTAKAAKAITQKTMHFAKIPVPALRLGFLPLLMAFLLPLLLRFNGFPTLLYEIMAHWRSRAISFW